MQLQFFNVLALLLSLQSSSIALPASPTEADATPAPTPKKQYASDASQLIALGLLKSNIDIDGNQVHSPLGVTSLLAVLAEAANGDTYKQFSDVFGFPEERAALRDSFKHILGKYHNREYNGVPSFQTWLYIYRNLTAIEEYKKILNDFYYVEVKDISRDLYDWNNPNTSLDYEALVDAIDSHEPETTPENSKDVVGFETLKRLNVDEPDGSKASISGDTYGEEVVDKVPSKFDRVVDDKQYVEKPVIIAEIEKQTHEEKQQEEAAKVVEIKNEKPSEVDALKQPAEDAKLNEQSKRAHDEVDASNPIENETVLADEKSYKNDAGGDAVVPIQEVLKSNAPEKVSIPLQKLENAIDAASKEAGEIMIALESHLSNVRRLYGGRSLFQKEDIASALSANSITGRESGSITKMLLFNGLYYRGYWANAFLEKSGENETFYMTAEDSVKLPMMHSRGEFHTADLTDLNAKVIFLPYQNPKYGMAIVVPNEIEGLRTVIDKMKIDDFKLARSKCEKRKLHVIMPKFQAEETSRSEAMLKNMGLTKLFSRKESNLTLLSGDDDLHVDELVQFVTVRVDEGGSLDTQLSGSLVQERSTEDDIEKFEVNRPFLYFILDNEENFVIASGKIQSPEFKAEQPIGLDIEFDKPSWALEGRF